MRSLRLIVTLTIAGAMLPLTGCNNSLKDELVLLEQENTGLREQLRDRNEALELAHQENGDLSRDVARLQMDLREAKTRRPAASVDTGFGGIDGVTGRYSSGEVTVQVESDVLFDSGKATLKASGKQSLDRVASVLSSKYNGKAIRVEGYTDTDPIRKSGYKSNYHLGFDRAYSVRDYLISRGVPSNRVYLASYGPDRPLSSKSQSRRVELVVALNE